MAKKGTIFFVADNTKIKYVKCLNVPQGLKNKGLYLSCLVPVFPQIFKRSKKFQRKKYTGLVVTLRDFTKRRGGIKLWFGQNRLLLFERNLRFMGTRVDGPICKELRLKKNKTRFKKIINYAKKCI